MVIGVAQAVIGEAQNEDEDEDEDEGAAVAEVFDYDSGSGGAEKTGEPNRTVTTYMTKTT